MTQVDSWDIPPNPNPALVVLPAINEMLVALRDGNSGPTAPSVTFAHMVWVDTSTSPLPTIRRRNSANSAWIAENTALGLGTAALADTGTATGNVPVLDANGKIPVTVATSSVGDAPVYGARAWINFNGATMAIGGSGNVSSVTDNGTGDYTINFTTAMPDVNCAVIATAGNTAITSSDAFRGMVLKSLTTTSVRVVHCRADGVPSDSAEICVAIFK